MSLGLVPVAIGWFYQRLLFRRQCTRDAGRSAAYLTDPRVALHAALTELRNFPTSSLSRLLLPDND